MGALLVPPSAQGQLLVEHRESRVAAAFNKRRQEAAGAREQLRVVQTHTSVTAYQGNT